MRWDESLVTQRIKFSVESRVMFNVKTLSFHVNSLEVHIGLSYTNRDTLILYNFDTCDSLRMEPTTNYLATYNKTHKLYKLRIMDICLIQNQVRHYCDEKHLKSFCSTCEL